MRKPALWALATVLAAVGLAYIATPADADSTTSVAADAMVKQFNTAYNGGTVTTLQADNNAGFVKYGLVQVAVPAVPDGEQLVSASLRVTVSGTVPAGAHLFADQVGNGWTETGVTYANQPAVTTAATDSATAAVGAVDIPVTATPGSTQSFRVRTDATQPVSFSGREGANPPALVLTTEAAPPPPPPPAMTRIGLSSANANWSTEFNRLNANGGITVRRIFISTLSQGGNDSRSQIVDALSHGLIPWVSFKTPSDTSNPAQYQSWVATTASQWEALSQQYGLPFYATIHHEPQGDMTAAQFLTLQRALAPTLAANCPDCKVAPILTSWQLDNPANDAADFDAWIATDLFANGTYSFMGFDSYVTPYDRVPLVEARLHGLGLDGVDLGVGEWNSQDASQISKAIGFVDDPRVIVACFWDSGQWYPLTPAREQAFESIVADPRVQH